MVITWMLKEKNTADAALAAHCEVARSSAEKDESEKRQEERSGRQERTQGTHAEERLGGGVDGDGEGERLIESLSDDNCVPQCLQGGGRKRGRSTASTP